ncbi:MAG: hypothetical protein KGD64_14660, partial [Candidatus Heimdallarchaeota archaeon]|nr:hypothetical protein [Candidatus Heimdallarchaeota archaeon]
MEMKEISIKDLYLLKEINSVQILPGKRYLFEEKELNKKEDKYNSSIYLLGDEDAKPQQFTSGLSMDKSMKLSPNKEFLAFLSERGGQTEKPQLHIMPVKGGESLKYTSLVNGVNSFKWSIDGSKIVFSHRVNIAEQEEENKKEEDKEELSEIDAKIKKLRLDETEKKKIDPRTIQKIVYRKGTAFMDDKTSHFYLLDVESKKIDRITSGVFNYTDAVLSKDSTKLYVAKQKETGQLNDLYEFIIEEITIETKEIKELITV